MISKVENEGGGATSVATHQALRRAGEEIALSLVDLTHLFSKNDH